jgi:hypothetical protein
VARPQVEYRSSLPGVADMVVLGRLGSQGMTAVSMSTHRRPLSCACVSQDSLIQIESKFMKRPMRLHVGRSVQPTAADVPGMSCL